MTVTNSGEDDDIIDRFSEGIKKFNDGDFYDCHDILEDVWFDIQGKYTNFLPGV